MNVCNIKNILIFLGLVAAGEGEAYECPDSSQQTTAYKIKESLLCNYDRSVRPVVNHKNGTTVTFRFILKHFSYDILTSMLSVDTWMPVYWKDQHLTWNPSDYEGIAEVRMPSSEIWIPDLSVYNSHTQTSPSVIDQNMMCTVSSKGVVFCVVPVHIDSLCVANMERYPFDEQECTISMGSWIHKGEEVGIKVAKLPVTTDDLEENGEWELSKISVTENEGKYQCCPNNTFPSVDIHLQMKRLSGGHAASVIIPSVVVMMITFTSLVVSPLNKERMYLCYVNLITQFFHVQYVSWMVPLRGENTPLILLFSRDSLLLSAIAIVFTLIVKHLMEQKTTPPLWISTVVSLVTGCQPGKVMLLNSNSFKGATRMDEDGETIINNSEPNTPPASSNCQDWFTFGRILDRLFVLSYFVVYFVMSIAFLP